MIDTITRSRVYMLNEVRPRLGPPPGHGGQAGAPVPPADRPRTLPRAGATLQDARQRYAPPPPARAGARGRTVRERPRGPARHGDASDLEPTPATRRSADRGGAPRRQPRLLPPLRS